MFKLLLRGLLLMTLLTTASAKATEEAPYQLLFKDDAFEIRTYRNLVLVGAPMNSENGAFKKLFRYITGSNEANQKIAMTAPVFMEYREDGQMEFVMPADMSIDSTPLPADSTVAVHLLEEQTYATIRFSGRLKQSNIAEHRAELIRWLEVNGIAITGEEKVAGYNSPMTLPFMRRNEILIPVQWSAENLDNMNL